MFENPLSRRSRIATTVDRRGLMLGKKTFDARPFAGSRLEGRANLAAALLTGILSTTALADSGAQWTSQGGDPQGTRYSTLNQITPSNVGKLVEEFSYPTGTKATHQGGPLVIGSVMYVVTPFPNNLIALDLKNPGKALWTFYPNPSGAARGLTCCDLTNRGAAYADGLVVYELLDGNVVAVNATTGKQVWRTQVAVPQQGETLNTAPLIANSKVIFGSSGGEMGIRGSLRALDLTTGKLLWRAFSTGPDADVQIGRNFHPFYAKDQGADLGQRSWPGTTWQQGGAASWGWLTYDPETNQIFYGTSNPGTWNPDERPGDNKWGATIFARNPDTGAANWAYQVIPHDNWDYDAVNEDTVLDLPINGVTRKVIVNFHKGGFAYMLDRVTGELISARPFAYQNWSNGYDLKTGLPNLNPAMETHQGVVTKGICPSSFGAKDWELSSFSKTTRLFYFGATNFCMNYEPLEVYYIAGTPFIGSNLQLYPGPGGNMGEFVAYDPVAGDRVWTIKEPLAVFGGALSTESNLVFYGTMDKRFKAVDARTGDLLFSTTLECGIASPPITYLGPDGKQRVAITTGLGRIQGGFSGGACPAGSAFGDGGGNSQGAAANGPQADAAARFAASQNRVAAAAATPTSGYVHVFKLP